MSIKESPLLPTNLSCQKFVSGMAIVAICVVFAFVRIGIGIAQENPKNVAHGQNAMVATVHPLATEAGIEAISSGGNAVDAAVAAAMTLGVVDGYNSGIGGGCFIMIRTPNGKTICIDARETAPAAAHRDMFMNDGKPDTSLSQVGPLAVAVPGALAGYAEAVKRFGKRSLSDLIKPAAKIADEGFVLSDDYAKLIKAEATNLLNFPASKAVFFTEDGLPVSGGNVLVQKDLARTYYQIASMGIEWFYCGEFAKATARWMSANGGLITEADFANYRTIDRAPIETTYRGLSIFGFPPPSSGGVHVAQILNIVENFDLPALCHDDPAKFTHVVSEAMKLAFADRAFWLGDPAYANVPRGLIDKSYSRELAAKIDLNKAITVDSHGVPPLAESDFFEKHTTHIATADKEGYWVAITTTVNTTFGSKVIVPGLGVILNNQMDDFAIAPGVPNAFGLVGNEANRVQSGKRPLSSMSPTIIVKDGRPIMTVGAAGGPRIVTQSLLAILRTIDLQMPLDDAIAAPRFHHQWSPDKLYLERGFDQATKEKLEKLGHRVELTSAAGISQAIIFDPNTKTFVGVADPRSGGTALGK